MTFFLLFILIAISIWLHLRRRRHFSRLFYINAAIFFVGAGCGPIPHILLNQLQAPYLDTEPVFIGPHQAIVLLGAGTQKIPGLSEPEAGTFSYARILKAAMLYYNCHQTHHECKIFISGGDPQKHGRSEAEVYETYLTQLHIPSHDIVVEKESKNTWQNAQFLRPLLQAYHPSQIFMITSGPHLARSVLYFSHFGIPAVPIRADYFAPIMSYFPLSYNFAMTDFALHEFVGQWQYWVYTKLGLNPPRSSETL